jgi:hypothetical protein
MEVLGGTYLGIRIWTLIAAAAILALVGVADAALRWIVRRKIRRDETSAAGETDRERERVRWFDRGLRSAVPPLALLIWIVGLHAVMAMGPREAHPVPAAAPSREPAPGPGGTGGDARRGPMSGSTSANMRLAASAGDDT